MTTALPGAAGDTISKLLPVHGGSVPGFGGGCPLDAAGNANPGQGGEVDFGGDCSDMNTAWWKNPQLKL
jgi:hypothetical protein